MDEQEARVYRLTQDEQVALALTCALLQGGKLPNDTELKAAYGAYSRMVSLIANTPESRARRGLAG